MSKERARLYEHQKETLDLLVIGAVRRRKDEAFVILILDLRDNFARDIAIAKTGQDAVDKNIRQREQTGELPCLMFDTSEHDANVFFETMQTWPSFRDSTVPDGMVCFAIVGDGGVSFGRHRVPFGPN